MSRGFNTRHIPKMVRDGIKNAYYDWEAMCGDWLHSAPEYLITVRVADQLMKEIVPTKRTLVMEGPVAKALTDAGSIQRGIKAKKLRHNGRFDIVLGNSRASPKVIIEIKNRIWNPTGDLITKDLNRICEALLHGKEHTNLDVGILGFYTDCAPVRTKTDATASARLEKKVWQKL